VDVVFVAGSPSRPSRSTAVLRAVRRALPEERLTAAEVHVRDLPPAALLRGDADDPEVAAAARLIENARPVVIATPVYKAAYSGALKAFLDLLPPTALAGKVVLPLAAGGSPGHRLYALKPVLSALGARHQLAGVFVRDDQAPWNGAALCGAHGDDAAAFALDEAADARLRSAAAELAALLLPGTDDPALPIASDTLTLLGGGI
jgi:FMN reductase